MIDAQQSFRQRAYWNEALGSAYLAEQNALIAGCAAIGVPVVRVYHTDEPSNATNPFAVESGHGAASGNVQRSFARVPWPAISSSARRSGAK